MGGLGPRASIPTAPIVSPPLSLSHTSHVPAPPFLTTGISFYYLTGADFPGCAATYDIGADKLTLWIPRAAPATVLWLGTTPSLEDCLARSDVHDVQYVTGLSAYLASRLPRVRALWALRGAQLPVFDGFERLKPRLTVDTDALLPAINEARLIKDEYEIAMIRKANDVSSAAHRAVARALLAGRLTNECQIEASFLNTVRAISSLFSLALVTSQCATRNWF